MTTDRTLLTPRLELRPIEPADASALHGLVVLPGVRRFLFDDEQLTPEQTVAMVEESVRLARDEGAGLWGARVHGQVELVGFCGFWYFREPPERELLFAVADAWWGRGLATEMASAMLRHGFDRLGYAGIVASTDTANVASVRVMEKAGMRFVRRATVGGLATIFYEALSDAPDRSRIA